MVKPAKKNENSWLEKLKFYTLSLMIVMLGVGGLWGSSQVVGYSQNHLQLVGDQLQLEANNFQPPVSQVLAVEATPKPLFIEKGLPAPEFESVAVLAEDLETGKVLYSKNANLRLSPASTTKIMTAVVGMDYYKLAQPLIVPKNALVGGSTMSLNLGEELTFRSLLYGMMLNSGNDAAFTIAANYPGGVSGFIEAMNQKALSLGLTDTQFQNPAGFDGDGHFSSAADLAKISRVAMSNPQFAKIVGTKETTVTALDQSKSHLLHNLNQLLNEPGVIGIKTGTTELAGENLVGLIEQDGRKILTVVLGSKDRFTETKQLLQWVADNYDWN